VRNLFGFNDMVDALTDQALEVMKKQGATLVDPAKIDSITKIGENELTVLLYELKADLNAYLARGGPGAAVHTLGDVIEFNDRHREKEMPYFGQDLFLKAQAKGPLTEKEYLNALEKSRQLAAKEGIDAVIDQLKLDAFVAPTAGPAWITDLVNGTTRREAVRPRQRSPAILTSLCLRDSYSVCRSASLFSDVLGASPR